MVPGPLWGISVKWIRETLCPSWRPGPFWASAFRGLGNGVAWCQESVPAPWGPGGACQGCGCRSKSESGAGLKFFSSCLESQHDGLCIPDNQTPLPPGLGALQAESLGAWQDLQNTAPSRPGQPSCLCEYRCQGPRGGGRPGPRTVDTPFCVGDPGSVRPEGWGVAEEGFGGWLRHWVVTMG